MFHPKGPNFRRSYRQQTLWYFIHWQDKDVYFRGNKSKVPFKFKGKKKHLKAVKYHGYRIDLNDAGSYLDSRMEEGHTVQHGLPHREVADLQLLL